MTEGVSTSLPNSRQPTLSAFSELFSERRIAVLLPCSPLDALRP